MEVLLVWRKCIHTTSQVFSRKHFHDWRTSSLRIDVIGWTGSLYFSTRLTFIKWRMTTVQLERNNRKECNSARPNLHQSVTQGWERRSWQLALCATIFGSCRITSSCIVVPKRFICHTSVQRWNVLPMWNLQLIMFNVQPWVVKYTWRSGESLVETGHRTGFYHTGMMQGPILGMFVTLRLLYLTPYPIE